MNVESSTLDWIEAQASKNMEFHTDCGSNLQASANTIFSIMLVAIGAMVGFFLNQYDATVGVRAQQWQILAPCVAVTLHLMVLAGFMIVKVITAREAQPPSNEPGKLLHHVSEYSTEQIRTFELENVQSRITHWVKRNENTAWWLNTIRFGLCFCPLVFCFVFVVMAVS